jgi:hypothetical protein
MEDLAVDEATRQVDGLQYRRRRHQCVSCGRRWSSYESLVNPRRLLQKIARLQAARAAAAAHLPDPVPVPTAPPIDPPVVVPVPPTRPPAAPPPTVVRVPPTSPRRSATSKYLQG